MSVWTTIRAAPATWPVLLVLLALALLDVATSRPVQTFGSARTTWSGGSDALMIVLADDEVLFYNEQDIWKEQPDGSTNWDAWSDHPQAYIIFHTDRPFRRGFWATAVKGTGCSISAFQLSNGVATHDPSILETAKTQLQASGYWYHAPNAPPVQYTMLWGGVARHIISPLLLAATLWSIKLNTKGGARAIAEYNRSELLRRRLCPSCRYNIANLPGESPTCPECGSSWNLHA